MIYADTSALAKLIAPEVETMALTAWLEHQGDAVLATNMVGVVELHRFAARIGPDVSAAAVRMTQRIDRMELNGSVYALAADVPPPAVRTLDALHIASAAVAPGLTAFLTYDLRMAEAASAFGLPVVSPG